MEGQLDEEDEEQKKKSVIYWPAISTGLNVEKAYILLARRSLNLNFRVIKVTQNLRGFPLKHQHQA